MRRYFDFTSSMSHFFGVKIYGQHRGKFWHSSLIMPMWKFGRTIHRIKQRLFCRFHPSYRFHIVDTGLNPGVHMGGKLILHASFSILMRSITFRYGTLDKLETHARNLQLAPVGSNPPELVFSELSFVKELIALVKWWTIQRPEDLSRVKVISAAIHADLQLVAKTDEIIGVKSLEFSATAPEYKDVEKELCSLRKKIADEETVMLHRLMDLRGWLD